jgi:hypothetical protein
VQSATNSFTAVCGMGSPAPTTLTAALIATLVVTAGAFAPSLVLPSLGGSPAGLRSSYHAKAAAGSIGAPFGASSIGRSALAAAKRISSPLKVSASLSGAFDRYFARNIADEVSKVLLPCVPSDLQRA